MMRLRLCAIALGLAAVSTTPAFAKTPASRETAAIRSATVNGITIAYRITGPAKGRPIVLLPGIGMQLIEWPPELVSGLEKRGYRVIALDMRDSGGSTAFTAAGAPDWAKILPALGAGQQPPLTYTADDMVRDVIGLLDHLKIERADILGLSGGATIGELIAIDHPQRVRSLNVIAANSGNPAVTVPADPKQFAGQAQPQVGETKDAMIARRVDTARRLAGSGGAFDTVVEDRLARAAVARNDDPFGTMRQGVPLLALRDLRPRLKSITAPTLVIHGAIDPLIAPQLGREVAETIPGATFLEVPGMGHNLPPQQVTAIVEAVDRNMRRAK